MTLRRALLGLSLAGIGVAGYLTWVHYAGSQPLCMMSGGCEKVQNSEWSQLAGIPVAVIGLVGYLLIFASLWVPGERGRLLGVALALPGCAFALYLTYHELFSIKAICQWCVASQTIILALAILTGVRFVRGEPVTRARGVGL